MRKLKLSIALDGFFIFSICFFIFYALIKPSAKSIWLATGFSVILSAIACFLFMTFLFYINKLKGDKQENINLINSFDKHLFLLKDSEIIKLISSYLDKLNYKFEVKNNAFYFNENKAVLYFSFTPDELSLTKAVEFYKNTPKGYNTAIIAPSYNKKLQEFFTGFLDISFYQTSDLYSALNSSNLLPPLSIDKKKKATINQLISRFLKRKNIKKFFLYGAILLLFSTITYYKIFYLIIGTGFLITATYLKFFAKN